MYLRVNTVDCAAQMGCVLVLITTQAAIVKHQNVPNLVKMVESVWVSMSVNVGKASQEKIAPYVSKQKLHHHSADC